MFLIIAGRFVFSWLLGFTVFHVAGGLIHILLIVVLVSSVLHFVRGRGAV